MNNIQPIDLNDLMLMIHGDQCSCVWYLEGRVCRSVAKTTCGTPNHFLF